MVYTRIQCIYITGFKNEGSFYELALANFLCSGAVALGRCECLSSYILFDLALANEPWFTPGFKGSFYELALAPVAYNSSTRTRTHVVLLL
jgi:hypothetical protein